MFQYLLFISLIILSPLLGEDSNLTDFDDNLSLEDNSTEEIEEQTIETQNVYLKYHSVPDRVYRGQIFPVTIKLTVISEQYDEVTYKFIGGTGIELLQLEPERETIDEDGVISVYDKFYFKVTSTRVVIPRVDIYLETTIDRGKEGTLGGRVIESIEIPPSQHFSHIFAKELEIYKTVADKYDESNNILTMFIRTEVADIDNTTFYEPYVIKQGLESKKSGSNFKKSDFLYYVVLPKYYDNFTFKYFNTEIFNFKKLSIPIEVEDDMVSTAKDLRPKNLDKNRQIKIAVFIGITIIFLVLFYFYQHWFYIIMASLGLIISISFLFPKPDVCVKDNSVVRIVPMLSSTGFQVVEGRTLYEKIAERGDFIKIRLSESSEGWVKVENVCEED